MKEDDYTNESFEASVKHDMGSIAVRKYSGTDGFNILAGVENGQVCEICIKSKNQAEQLHFWLGQMLGK